MLIVYLLTPCGSFCEGDIFVESGDWSTCGFHKSECLWIVPGTIDPMED